MRTTIQIDTDLLKAIQKLAIQRGQSVTSIVEDALRELLIRQRAQQRATSRRERVQLVTFEGNGLLPGVNLDDSASLLELMETKDDLDRC